MYRRNSIREFRVTVCMNEKERDDLEEIAERTGETYSRIIRDSLRLYRATIIGKEESNNG